MNAYSAVELAKNPVLNLSSEMVRAAREAAIRGLEFMCRCQNKDEFSANRGRYATVYDFKTAETSRYTGNWMSAISIEAMLLGYSLTGKQEYCDSAKLAVDYLKSLQEFAPEYTRLRGVFHEETPQSPNTYPRDALTAAWALLDWSTATGDSDAFDRAVTFADWFVEVGMEHGYPYWQVRFDGKPWEPAWYGSFHSGSAYFLGRMYRELGTESYRLAMRSILEQFNTRHLDENGKITVIVDIATGKVLDGIAPSPESNRPWEMMHVYNDDFGSLANLLAWKIEQCDDYLLAARRFLRRMVQSQRADGGFGPANYSVPSAAGMILVELLAGIKHGHDWAGEDTIERAINYLLSIQVTAPSSPADGAFREFEEGIAQECMVMRTQAYCVIALLYCAGAVGANYIP